MMDKLRRRLVVLYDLAVFVYTKLTPWAGLYLAFLIVAVAISGIQLVVEPSSRVIFMLVAISTLLLSVVDVGRRLWSSREIGRSPNPDIESRWKETLPSIAEEDDGFRVYSLPMHGNESSSQPHTSSRWMLMSPDLNRFLRDPATDFRVVRDRDHEYAVLDGLREDRELVTDILRAAGSDAIWGKFDFRNETKVGICSPVLTSAKRVSLIKTDYYSGYLTNHQVSVRLGDASAELHLKQPYPVVTSGGSSRFKDLGETLLANHTGASTLGLSADGYLVLWTQDSSAMVSQGLLAPTGSGSTDWSDSVGRDSLKRIILRTIVRELCEESVKRRPRIPISASMITGYYRNIVLGGKPEFVGISKLSINASRLFPNPSEVKRGYSCANNRKITSVAELSALVDDLLVPHRQPLLSTPLWAALLALQQFIEEDQAGVAAFFGLS